MLKRNCYLASSRNFWQTDFNMTNPVSKLPIQAMSFGLALLIQTIALVGYIAGIAGDVKTAVRDIDRNVSRIDRLETTVQAQEVLLARMAADMAAIRKSVERMDARASNRN